MRSCFSIVLLLLLFVSLSTAFFFFDVRRALLNPVNIKTALVENKAYENFVNNTLPVLLKDSFGKNTEANIPVGLITEMAKKVITPADLKTDLELAIDKVLPYLNGNDESLDFTIDLTKYKTNFAENYKPTFTNYVNSLAVCTTNTTLEEASIQNCRPKGKTADQLYNETGAREVETSFATSLPNKIIVSEKSILFDPPLKNQVEVEQEREIEPQNFRLLDIKKFLSLSMGAFFASLIAALISLLLLFLLWGKQFRKSLTYVSWALLGFVIFLPIGLFLFAVPRANLVNSISQNETWAWLSGFVISLAISILAPLFWQAVTCIVIAVGILVLLNLVLRNKTKEAPKTS